MGSWAWGGTQWVWNGQLKRRRPRMGKSNSTNAGCRGKTKLKKPCFFKRIVILGCDTCYVLIE